MTSLDDPADAEWESGPPMNEARINHECGRIRTSIDTDDYSIIVVGGTVDKQSVEIYDINNGTWQSGPQLPSKTSF